MAKWKKTNFPGVRYREHPTRKNGVKRDQYFTIRYKVARKGKEEGLGWASEGWTAAKAYERLSEIKQNIKSAEGPQSLKEKRTIEAARRKKEMETEERLAKESISFEQFFREIYLPQTKADKKERTVIREEGLLRILIAPTIGRLPLKDVASFHLEKLKKDMANRGQSQRSIEYALAVVRQIFNTARRFGFWDGDNPTSKVKIPKPDNSRMRFLTRDEANALLQALREKSIDIHDITLLSLHCGLRFGEIAALTWQDVNLENEVLTIRDAKTGSRYAFLTEQAKKVLKGRLQGSPSNYVFGGRRGKIESLSRTFVRTVKELGLNNGIEDPRFKITFHSCRHSYASWLVEQGTDLYTVQKLLGHKTNVMTQRYAHLAEGQLRNAARRLSARLKSKKDDAKVIHLDK